MQQLIYASLNLTTEGRRAVDKYPWKLNLHKRIYVVDTLDARLRMKNQLLQKELIVAKGMFILDLIYILAKFNW